MKKLAGILLVFAMLATAALPAAAQQSDPATGQTPVTLRLVAPDVLARAEAALNAGQYDRAVLDLSLFILLNPTYSIAYYERAHSYLGMREFEKALEDANHALRTTPDGATPEFGAALYLLRGDIETQLSQFDDAVADYTQSLSLSPMPEALFSRGLIYATRNEFQAALTDMSDAIALDSTNPLFFIYRGQINTAVQDYQAAGADYLDYFNLASAPRDGAELKTGQAVTLPMERGVVYRVPFAARAGQFASARAIGESNTVDPLIVLLDPQGNALVGDDDGGGNLTALIFDFPIPEDGEYTLMVGHSFGGFSGNVSLQLRITDTPNR